MLQPVGPLPPSTYWRRRAVAVGGAVVLVVGVVWAGTAVAGAGAGAAAENGPGATVAAPTTNPAESTAAESTAAESTAAESTAADSTTTGTTTTAPDAEPGAESAPTTGGASTNVTPSDAAAEGAVAACGDEMIGLTAQVEQPSYPVGQQPVFRLVVTNTGPQPCTRALDAGLQQALVYGADGATRLWSSDDCFPGEGTEQATLAPGEERVYSVRWAGTTTEPGCEVPREPVPAGEYAVVVALGELRSEPVPFTLVAP